MKEDVTYFFHSIGLFNPLDFTDPVTYFIPGFILLILAEIFLDQIPQKVFTKRLIKDNISSIGLGIGGGNVRLWDESYFIILLFLDLQSF